MQNATENPQSNKQVNLHTQGKVWSISPVFLHFMPFFERKKLLREEALGIGSLSLRSLPFTNKQKKPPSFSSSDGNYQTQTQNSGFGNQNRK